MGGRATHWGVTGSTGLSGRWLLVRPGLRRPGSVERHPPATLGNPGGQGGVPRIFHPSLTNCGRILGISPRRLRLDWVSWLYPVTVSTRKVSKGCRPAASGGDGVGLTEARTPARRLHRRKVVGSDPPRSTSMCRAISGRRGSRRPACSKRFEEGISCGFVRRCLLSGTHCSVSSCFENQAFRYRLWRLHPVLSHRVASSWVGNRVGGCLAFRRHSDRVTPGAPHEKSPSV